jgi:hypothetical protein
MDMRTSSIALAIAIGKTAPDWFLFFAPGGFSDAYDG